MVVIFFNVQNVSILFGLQHKLHHNINNIIKSLRKVLIIGILRILQMITLLNICIAL